MNLVIIFVSHTQTMQIKQNYPGNEYVHVMSSYFWATTFYIWVCPKDKLIQKLMSIPVLIEFIYFIEESECITDDKYGSTCNKFNYSDSKINSV